MKKPMIRIHNIETDEIIDREMTDDEFEQYQIEQKQYEKTEIEKENSILAKNALLSKLGITADEAKLLLS